MRNTTRHLGAILDCYKALFLPEDTFFQRPSTVDVNRMELKNNDAVRELEVMVDGQSVEEY